MSYHPGERRSRRTTCSGEQFQLTEADQMGIRAVARLTAPIAVLLCVAMGPVADASASAKSIKSAIRSFSSKILVAEGHVLSAGGEYETSKDPTGVIEAISQSVSVLSALEVKVAHQPALAPRVKRARSKVVHGLHTVIVGYEQLSGAFGEKAMDPEAAKVAAAAAEVLATKGRNELKQGVKLLG
jgi:hypothetical protein